MERFFFFSLLVLMGCVGVKYDTGYDKTIQEPLHTKKGAAITLWKVPVIGIGGWGNDLLGGNKVPGVVIHHYNYQAQPQSLPPGAPPSPPGPPQPLSQALVPAPANYPTNYGPRGDEYDVVVLVNNTEFFKKAQIDDKQEIILKPFSATVDLSVDPGPHFLRITTNRPSSKPNVTSDWTELRQFTVDPRGQRQIINLN